MIKRSIVIAACLLLAACANADGSRPRLAPSSAAGPGAAGFNGGYAGANYGFSNLNTKSVPF